jgi:hypothetical protein
MVTERPEPIALLYVGRMTIRAPLRLTIGDAVALSQPAIYPGRSMPLGGGSKSMLAFDIARRLNRWDSVRSAISRFRG